MPTPPKPPLFDDDDDDDETQLTPPPFDDHGEGQAGDAKQPSLADEDDEGTVVDERTRIDPRRD